MTMGGELEEEVVWVVKEGEWRRRMVMDDRTKVGELEEKGGGEGGGMEEEGGREGGGMEEEDGGGRRRRVVGGGGSDRLGQK